MESEDQPIEPVMLNMLYYTTHQSTTETALEEFIGVLLKRGFSIEFIGTMQLDAFPKSTTTGFIACMAQYRN